MKNQAARDSRILELRKAGMKIKDICAEVDATINVVEYVIRQATSEKIESTLQVHLPGLKWLTVYSPSGQYGGSGSPEAYRKIMIKRGYETRMITDKKDIGLKPRYFNADEA